MGSVICRAESGGGTWCCMYSVIEGLSIVQNVSLLVLKNDIERLKDHYSVLPLHQSHQARKANGLEQ